MIQSITQNVEHNPGTVPVIPLQMHYFRLPVAFLS